MKIKRKDIIGNDYAYRSHLRAETWANAIWALKHMSKNIDEKERLVASVLSIYRNMLRMERKAAIRAELTRRSA